MDTNIVNILSNPCATFEGQFMKKLSKTELKKALLIKKKRVNDLEMLCKLK